MCTKIKSGEWDVPSGMCTKLKSGEWLGKDWGLGEEGSGALWEIKGKEANEWTINFGEHF